MKELVIRARQHTGGLWELELEGTDYRGAGATMREAFECLLEIMFAKAVEVALKDAGLLDA